MKLPIANGAVVRHRVGGLLAAHRSEIVIVLVLQLGSALAAIALPWAMGHAVDRIQQGTSLNWVRTVMLAAVGAVVVGAVLSYFAEYRARVLGEKVFAKLREDLVRTVTHLPLSTVESAGTGDLVGRTTHDIDRVQFTVRQGISSMLVLGTTIVVTVVAAVATSPLLSLVLLLEVPAVWVLMKWYLPRTIPAYRASAASWAGLSGTVNETIEQAETVDAARLVPLRIARLDTAVGEVWRLERYAAWMRVFLIAGLGFVSLMPVLGMVLVGAWAVPAGAVTLGQVTTAALYAYQLRGPVWEATFWIDQIQYTQASLSRIFGVDLVEPDREASGELPHDRHISAHDVHYAYRAGEDVLHGVDLDLRPGETLAMVGPSGAGKSTFGRMLAGIHPPTSGSVAVGGVELVDLEEDVLQGQVVLVTQEHHVFVGTIADNLRLARSDATDAQVHSALAAVEADEWVDRLGEGMDTRVGAGGLTLSPAQAQQLALARIVLMDPHTLVLDEATSLMDPTAARSLERSLSKVLQGRTVVAIAHRLYTAHDADRVAVMMDGNIVELGPHEQLVAAGGEYASLWESWQKD
ncbi:ABC transporter ATP-binding protein [Actinomyces sp.]|uniref:ABC transporter ATP-binding protein n=1 Tax=Actinomyces sp. TaxID=29317 RepID=UPI002896763D|nr:ABC transporter ATP-binding protein [Actinomyces sp.]